MKEKIKRERDPHEMQLGSSAPEVIESINGNFFFKSSLKYRVRQGSASYGPQLQSGLLPVFANRALLEQPH